MGPWLAGVIVLTVIQLVGAGIGIKFCQNDEIEGFVFRAFLTLLWPLVLIGLLLFLVGFFLFPRPSFEFCFLNKFSFRDFDRVH